MLILSILPVAVNAQAACVPDAPEIGDIGPSSTVVCDQLEGRFAGGDLAVEGRSIQSPTEVTVFASVDGNPMRMRYELFGYTWRLTAAETGTVERPVPPAGLAVRE